MALNSTHPQYVAFKSDWELTAVSYQGQRAVKEQRSTYLPYTSGQIADGVVNQSDPGYKAYEAYLTRARYPGFFKQAVQTAIGMMHHNPPNIEVPKKLEKMLERATVNGESLEDLLRKINTEQLKNGRLGLLLDIPRKGAADDTPLIAMYSAGTVVNWDNGSRDELLAQKLNMVVLNETEQVRNDNFEWEQEEKYRVLTLGPTETNEANGTYRYGVFKLSDGFSEEGLRSPVYRGRTLSEIPFVFVNAVDLVPEPDQPPLLDLANLCMTIYRGEADYRQSLFMQGQDTLVIVGGTDAGEDEELRTGAGARVEVPLGGDAKYIGVSATGLGEQRQSLENDRRLAGSMGAGTLDTTSRERESGKSLNTRIAARTADLNQIADAGAGALKKILQLAAEWVGADPSQVVVEPNKDFGDVGIVGQEAVDWTAARNQGLPLSARSMHEYLVAKGMTRLTFEEEIARIEEEKDGPFDPTNQNADRNPEQTSDVPPSEEDE